LKVEENGHIFVGKFYSEVMRMTFLMKLIF